MKIEPSEFFPASRREGIISKQVDGELLVYDRTRDQAHCLNESAAAIWRLCDGRTSVPEIARRLGVVEGSGRESVGGGQTAVGGIDEQVVWLGLDELRRKHLLEEPATWPQLQLGIGSMSRREAVRRIGLGAAIALPVVISITAPTPAQAGTCAHANATCSTGADCCSGTCQNQPTGPPKCLGG